MNAKSGGDLFRNGGGRQGSHHTLEKGAPFSRPPHGFTIVELLVVAALMAMLFGIILVGVRPGAGGNVRRSARQVASALLAAQSRAIGSRIGAAVLFETDGGLGEEPGNNRAVRLRDAEMAPHITAVIDSPFARPDFNPADSFVTITPPQGAQQVPPIVPENASESDLDAGLRIRFCDYAARNSAAPWSPWYAFLPANESRSQPIVEMRVEDGQTIENTVWPSPMAVKYAIEIARYPGVGTVAFELPAAVVIDLRYSGHGDNPESVWGSLGAKGVIGISFDTVGKVNLLMQNVTGAGGIRAVQPLPPREPIYLFVVARAGFDAEAQRLPGSTSTLASNDANWILLNPETGRVTIAANQPQPVAAGTRATSEQLRRARELVRKAAALRE
jgi:prepilin-type N-terminal cleavage/methylation domain-containing protein